jgi:hypothetical protein
MGPVDYAHSFGLLQCDRSKPKYFYAHRLDVPLVRVPLRFGINEVLVTGSTVDSAQTDPLREEYYGQKRTWEWLYMLPFVPYSFAQQLFGDKDNALLSFDLNLLWPRRFRWYAEVFFDDITEPWKIWSKDWGNKWAVTVGGQYFGSILGKDMLALLEYSRVEPWVYTHFYGGSHRYTHYGQPLGAPAGPNSDLLTAAVEMQVAGIHTLGLAVRNARKGTSRGSSVRDVFQDTTDSKTKRFLGPGSLQRAEVELLWKANPFGVFAVNTRVSYGTGGRWVVRADGGLVF